MRPVLYGEAARKEKRDAWVLSLMALACFAGLLWAFLANY